MDTIDEDAGKAGKAGKTAADHRRDRAAAQLRANLMRRKQQIRARRSGREDSREGSLKAAPDENALPDAASGPDQPDESK